MRSIKTAIGLILSISASLIALVCMLYVYLVMDEKRALTFEIQQMDMSVFALYDWVYLFLFIFLVLTMIFLGVRLIWKSNGPESIAEAMVSNRMFRLGMAALFCIQGGMMAYRIYRKMQFAKQGIDDQGLIATVAIFASLLIGIFFFQAAVLLFTKRPASVKQDVLDDLGELV